MNLGFSPSLLWSIPVALSILTVLLARKAWVASGHARATWTKGPTKTPARVSSANEGRKGCTTALAVAMVLIFPAGLALLLSFGREGSAFLFLLALGYLGLALPWIGGALLVGLTLWLAVLGVRGYRVLRAAHGARPAPPAGGDRPRGARRTLLVASGLLAAYSGVLVWRGSLGPCDLNVVDAARRTPLAGARVTRVLFEDHALAFLLGQRRTHEVVWSRLEATTDAAGVVHFPGWVSLLPGSLSGIRGIGLRVDAPQHVMASVCVAPSGETGFLNESPCTSWPRSRGDQFGVEAFRSKGRLSIDLRLAEITEPSDVTANLELLMQGLANGSTAPATLLEKARDYARHWQFTAPDVTMLSSAASMRDSPALARPFPVAGDELDAMAQSFCDKDLDAYPNVCEQRWESWGPDAIRTRRLVLGAIGPNGRSADEKPALRQRRLPPGTRFHPGYRPSWRAMVAQGLRNGAPEAAPLGRSMWLQELLSLPDLAAPDRAIVSAALTKLESDPGARLQEMHPWLRCARVGLASEGPFPGAAGVMLSALGIPFRTIVPDYPRADGGDAPTPVTLIASYGLPLEASGRDSRESVRAGLAAYVRRGGTLAVLAHPRGEDFGILPVPAGQKLVAVGSEAAWSPDLKSVRAGSEHPATAFTEARGLEAAVDGFFTAWPAGSEILLTASGNRMPVALAYRVGAGRVVVTSFYEDQSLWERQEHREALTFMGALLRWLDSVGQPMAGCHAGEPCLVRWDVPIRNLGTERADAVRWRLASVPDGTTVREWTDRVLVETGGRVVRPVEIVVAAEHLRPGLHELSYTLLDTTRPVRVADLPVPWLVQAAAPAGLLALYGAPPPAPIVGVGLSSGETQVADGNVVTFTLALAQYIGAPRPWHVVVDYRNNHATEWIEAARVELTPDATGFASADVEVGPVPIKRRLGINGGCRVRARVYSRAADAPAATSVAYLRPG